MRLHGQICAMRPNAKGSLKTSVSTFIPQSFNPRPDYPAPFPAYNARHPFPFPIVSGCLSNPAKAAWQNIANKVVIITGASSGIGEATAYKLAREGAKIVLGARREDKLKAIADQIKASGGEAVYRVTDVVKPEDNAALVALAKEVFGKVDVIFLNAGLMPS